jgi:hypothetical protein
MECLYLRFYLRGVCRPPHNHVSVAGLLHVDFRFRTILAQDRDLIEFELLMQRHGGVVR